MSDEKRQPEAEAPADSAAMDAQVRTLLAPDAPVDSGGASELDDIVASALDGAWDADSAAEPSESTPELRPANVASPEARPEVGADAASPQLEVADPLDGSVETALNQAQAALDDLAEQVAADSSPDAGNQAPAPRAAKPGPSVPVAATSVAIPNAAPVAEVDAAIAAEAAGITDDDFADAAAVLTPAAKPAATAPAVADAPAAAQPAKAAAPADAASPPPNVPAVPAAEPHKVTSTPEAATVEVPLEAKPRRSVLALVGGLAVAILGPTALWYAALSKTIQQTLAWIAIGTAFNAGAVWVAIGVMGKGGAPANGPGSVLLSGGHDDEAHAAVAAAAGVAGNHGKEAHGAAPAAKDAHAGGGHGAKPAKPAKDAHASPAKKDAHAAPAKKDAHSKPAPKKETAKAKKGGGH
ncbi:MAG: hypothetical protein ACT4PL_12095 [Phycisphaerales bacterium]